MERRRGARIPARFWVQISGVDDEPVLRRGDISMSGAYVELDQPIGSPGSVQRLTVAPDGNEEAIVQLLARVVRVVSIQDLWHEGPGIAGVAFEFLPEAREKREVLTSIIRSVMASRSYVAESVVIGSSGFDAQVGAAPAETDAKMGVRLMVLETSWPVNVGEAIQCEIDVAGRRATLSGRVVRTTREDGASRCYRVEVDFQRPPCNEQGADAPAGRSISDAMDSLLEDVVFPEPTETGSVHQQLSGCFERVRLGELLAFIEVESVSGVITIARDASAATVHIRDGRVVDAEVTPGPDDPRDAIILLCSFVAGDFEFNPEPVTRRDRIEASVAELLATPA